MEDTIFNAYLEDRCPLCDSDNLSLVSENIGAGKTLSSTFFCISCKSDYVVGFNRSFNPIKSEILVDNYNEKSLVLNKKTHNALLISKAPELLEMLIKCTDALNKTTEYDVLERYQKLVDNANKLITEATTL